MPRYTVGQYNPRRYQMLPAAGLVGAGTAGYIGRQIRKAIREYFAQERPSQSSQSRQPRSKKVYTRNAGTQTTPNKLHTRVSANKRKRKRISESDSIKHQIQELRKRAEADMGTLVVRFRDSFSQRTVAHGDSLKINYTGLNKARIETVLGKMLFYDPTAPTVLVAASGDSGTYSRSYYFDNVYSKLTLRNNYMVPAQVRIYCVIPKQSTDVSSYNSVVNGLANNPGTTFPITSPSVFITDVQEFNDLWKIEKSVMKTLDPGEDISMSYNAKAFMYDPSTVDDQSMAYNKKHGTHQFIVAVSGVIGHDTSLGEYQLSKAGVDSLLETTVRVVYQAGADIKVMELEDATDNITNNVEISNKPANANQNYGL